MEPLDLRTHRPRSPHAQLDGLYFLPRTIDKIRASLPGGHLGPYHVAPGMSGILLDLIGVTLADLTAAVASAKDDAEVAAWLRERTDPQQYERANAVLANMKGSDIPPDRQARFQSLYAAELRAKHPVNFDLLDADDDAIFQRA